MATKKRKFRKIGTIKVKLTTKQLKALVAAAKKAAAGKKSGAYVDVPIYEPKNSPFRVPA